MEFKKKVWIQRLLFKIHVFLKYYTFSINFWKIPRTAKSFKPLCFGAWGFATVWPHGLWDFSWGWSWPQESQAGTPWQGARMTSVVPLCLCGWLSSCHRDINGIPTTALVEHTDSPGENPPSAEGLTLGSVGSFLNQNGGHEHPLHSVISVELTGTSVCCKPRSENSGHLAPQPKVCFLLAFVCPCSWLIAA